MLVMLTADHCAVSDSNSYSVSGVGGMVFVEVKPCTSGFNSRRMHITAFDGIRLVPIWGIWEVRICGCVYMFVCLWGY